MDISNILIALSTTFSAIAAFLAIRISKKSIRLSEELNEKQNIHNMNSIKPIADITIHDNEDIIGVVLKNVGTGPLIIKTLKCINTQLSNNLPTESLISHLEIYRKYFSTFAENIDGRAIGANSELSLLIINKPFSISDNIKIIKKIRCVLANINVELTYLDVYENEYKKSRKLDLFNHEIRE